MLAIITTFCYASAGLFAHFAYDYEDKPINIAVIRSIVVCIIMFTGLIIFKPDALKIKRENIKPLAIYGLIGMFCIPFFNLSAIRHTSIATASILASLSPIFVVVFAKFYLKEKLTFQKTLALILTLLGTSLVVQIYEPSLFRLNIKGVIFGLATSLSFAVWTIIGKKLIENINHWTAIFYGMFFGTIALTIYRLPQGKLDLEYPSQFWLGIIALAIFPAILADILYILALKYIQASKVSIISTLKTPIAAIFAFLFFSQSLDLLQIYGILLVIFGVWKIQKKNPKKLIRPVNYTLTKINIQKN